MGTLTSWGSTGAIWCHIAGLRAKNLERLMRKFRPRMLPAAGHGCDLVASRRARIPTLGINAYLKNHYLPTHDFFLFFKVLSPFFGVFFLGFQGFLFFFWKKITGYTNKVFWVGIKAISENPMFSGF